MMTNMRLFVATLALLASASAYAPSQRSARRPTRMAAEVVDRRAALSAAVSGAVALGALGALAPAARAALLARVPDRWESEARVAGVTCAIMQFHKQRDEIVPVALGRRLAEVARAAHGARARFVEIPGDAKTFRKHHTDSMNSGAWRAAMGELLDAQCPLD